MTKEKIKELIEIAKKKTKEDFIKFLNNVYNIDECVFEHLWGIPIISLYDEEILNQLVLDEKTKEELFDILNEIVKNELKDNISCVIPIQKITDELNIDELEELNKQKNSINYDFVIFYNKTKLQEKYQELIEKNSKKEEPKEESEIDNVFIDYLKGIITYQICYINANYYFYNKKDKNILSNEINNSIINILRKIINNFSNQDSNIEDLLCRIINKMDYNDLKEKEILLIYVLFNDEITKWLMFGAYDNKKNNKLVKILSNICKGEKINSWDELKEKIKEYIYNLEENNLTQKQIDMIKMLGFSIKQSNAESKNEIVEYKKQKWYRKLITKILSVFKNK